MKKRNEAAGLFLLAFVFLCSVLAGMAIHPLITSQAQDGPAAAEPAAVHPPAQFMDDVNAYVKLVADVQQFMAKVKATKEWKQYQDASDRAAGMQLRIQQQVPRGWRYDSKTQMFLPPPAPPAHPAPKPAPPAADRDGKPADAK